VDGRNEAIVLLSVIFQIEAEAMNSERASRRREPRGLQRGKSGATHMELHEILNRKGRSYGQLGAGEYGE